MSQAEFARHRGVSKAIVTKWKSQGLLSLAADGWVEDGPDVRLARLRALMDDMEGRS